MVFAAIDGAARTCTAVGTFAEDWLLQALDDGLIIVPMSVATARKIWIDQEPVDDVFAISYQRPALPPPAGDDR
ncbi:MAG: hypothetical protein ACREP7_18310 [Lysobacter sp.]